MGQQQLLLLVLGIVIVGLAVVAGIQVFGESKKKSDADALVNDAVSIAAEVQAWSLKPASFGGPGSDENIGDATLVDIGYGNSPYASLNGEYTLSSQGDGCVTVKGISTSQVGNEVYVKVTGTNPEDVETTVNPSEVLTCG